MNPIDRIVELVSPAQALRRQAARNALRMGAEYYQGSRGNRLTYNWTTGTESADTAIDGELETLRDRSRDLNRNNAVASGVTDTFCNNVVHSGLRPQSQVDAGALGISDDQAAAYQKQAEKIWAKWVTYASADNRLTFYEIQDLAIRQVLESGEFLAVRRVLRSKARPYMLALDIIEPDRLDNPPGTKADENIRFGVRKDHYGAPTSYSIRKAHPGDNYVNRKNYQEFSVVKAHDTRGRPLVFHVFPTLRPGQTRGVPFFAPVMENFKILADYLEAELVAARVGACFAAFVKTDYAYGAAVANAIDTNSDGQRLDGMEPGMVEYLGPGEDVTFSKPERPGATFDSFVERILRMIGSSLGLPYELVLKDFSKTNYSSARAALLQAYRVFQKWQNLLIHHLCQPVWEILLEEAFLKGELVAPGFEGKRYEYTRALWIPPGWAWVDPAKEVQANKMAVDMGFKTRADVCQEHGADWEQKAEQMAREKAKYEQLDLPFNQEMEIVENAAAAQAEQQGQGQETE